ncbi:phosphoglycerate mutase family protein [Paenarthrobacter sp. NPDC018779]|uniref:phosphoglycerate mutase family protein n=1 Tax=Paenarthrobacter sp. NPDC018779 TaxID=3364375 RepID=UPI0037C6A291
MSAPGRIFMIRHGQSAANADTSIYNRVPDYRIPLTARGVEEARIAGEKLRRRLNGEQVCVYVSPYLRAYQTLEALNLGPLVERVIEEPRLREQDWANFQIAGDIEHAVVPLDRGVLRILEQSRECRIADADQDRRRAVRPG